jgi:hypothetical protein
MQKVVVVFDSEYPEKVVLIIAQEIAKEFSKLYDDNKVAD